MFAAAGDPVGTGLVASLARPGANITGLSVQQTDLAGKRLEILREDLPGVRTLGIVANAGSAIAVAHHKPEAHCYFGAWRAVADNVFVPRVR